MNDFTDINIFLIGMMGSGKTTVGRLLAKKLSLSFVDLDLEIEKSEGLTIADIFYEQGAGQFRQLERTILKKTIQTTGQVIATGGGIVLNYTNQKSIISNGIAVLLRCQMKTLSRRLKDIRNRPLLSSNDTTQRTLNKIWRDRQEFYYSTARITFDNDFVNPSTAVTQIIRQIKGINGNYKG